MPREDDTAGKDVAGRTTGDVFEKDAVERESRYVGIVPVELLYHFKGSTLLDDVYVMRGTECSMLIPSGRTITGVMIDSLAEHNISFVSVTSPVYYQYLRETGELNKIHSIPLSDDEGGFFSVSEMRDNFYKLSAEAMASRGLDPNTVEGMMKQVVGISESIMGFGKVLSSMRSISNYSEYTYKHSLEVMIMSLLLAKQLEKDGKIDKMSQKQTLSLALGAFFHDIGKMMVPLKILNKPARLSDEEREHINAHVSAGYLLMKNMVMPYLRENFASLIDEDMILSIVGMHHWRFDNGGKSYGVDGLDVTKWSMLVGVADATDAMGTDRKYQKRRPNLPIKKIIEEEKGKQFHPDFADAMIEILVDYPENSITVFHDGSFGTVSKYHSEDGSIEVDMYGTITSAGIDRYRQGTVRLEKDEAREEIAVGLCSYDVLDREVGGYISTNPASRLAQAVFIDGPEFTAPPRDSSRDEMELFARSVGNFIRDAVGGLNEIEKAVKFHKRSAEKSIGESRDRINKLVDRVFQDRYGSGYFSVSERSFSERGAADEVALE